MEKFGTKEENSLTVLKHFVCSAAPHKTLCPGILLSCSLLPLHNEWVQWLERGSVNAAEIECYCVNANIAIARPRIQIITEWPGRRGGRLMPTDTVTAAAANSESDSGCQPGPA